ncbi:MAG: transposase [Gemmatimonadota bacterium]
MYARGMTVREIREHIEELYQVEVSADVISAVTDEVIEELTEWQQRPLERCYPVVFLDALRVKIRDEGVVRTKAVYVVLGITSRGTRTFWAFGSSRPGGGGRSSGSSVE